MVGTVTIGAKDGAAVEEARRRIELILDPPTAEVGADLRRQGRQHHQVRRLRQHPPRPGRPAPHLQARAAASGSTGSRTCSTLGQTSRGAGRRHRPAGQGVAVAGRRRADGAGGRPAAADAAPRRWRPRSAATARRPCRPARDRSTERPAGERRRRLVRGRASRPSWSAEFGDLGPGGGRRPTAAAARRPRRRRRRPARRRGRRRRRCRCRPDDPDRSGSPSRHPPGHRAHGRRPLGVRSASGSAPARATSPASWPARRTSSSTCCSRAPPTARPRPSPRRSTRSAATATPSPPRSTRPSTSGCSPSTSPSGSTSSPTSCGSPALRPADVEAERQVILDEILMHADEPADLAAEQWHRRAVPRPPARARGARAPPAIGGGHEPPTTSAASSSEHYRPGNMVVAAAGDLDHDAVADGLERRFAGPPGAPRPSATAPGDHGRAAAVIAPADRAGPPRLWRRGRSTGSTERRYALAVLNHVLGGGMSSRLFQEVRERRGLAYSVWSDRAAYHDAGSLAVVAGHRPRARRRGARDRRPTSSSCWPTDGITERELAVAKGNLRAETLLACEDSGARMSRIGAAACCTARCSPSTRSSPASTPSTRRRSLAVADRVSARPAHPRRRRPVRRGRLRRPPDRHGRPVASRPCTRSGWSAPAAAWAEVCRRRRRRARPRAGRRRRPDHAGIDRSSSAARTRIAGDGRTRSRDAGAEVVVDFTVADAARAQPARWCAEHGIHAVVGTTGLTDDDLAGSRTRFEARRTPTAWWPPTSPSGRC